MNTKEFAEKIGVSQPRVSKWIRDGVLKISVKKTGRFYSVDLKAAKAELKRNLDHGRKVKAKIDNRQEKKEVPTNTEKQKTVGQAKAQGLDFQTARALNEQYKAALKKLQYEREHKILINVDEVKRVGFEAGKQIKDSCLAIPDRCAPLVAACSDAFKCKEILLKEISYILENLSSALAVIK